VVSDFIDTFFRENARRALAREPPLTAREAKERWTELMEKRAAFYPRQGRKQAAMPSGGGGGVGRSDSRGRGGGGKRGGGNSKPRGGSMNNGRGAKLNGDSVCYHYNRASGCNRTPKGVGCCNGNGGVYAHVCNFETGQGSYCLAKHPRAGNH
jgi:hypothetical protein